MRLFIVALARRGEYKRYQYAPPCILFRSPFSSGIAAYAMFAPGEIFGSEMQESRRSRRTSPASAGETIIITVVATDDQGTLRINSSLPGSILDVTGCSVNDQASRGEHLHRQPHCRLWSGHS